MFTFWNAKCPRPDVNQAIQFPSSLRSWPLPRRDCFSGATTKALTFLTNIALLSPLAAADPGYFRIGDARGDSVVVRIVNDAAKQKARDILAGRSRSAIMVGNVVAAPAFYNPGWDFHVDPVSIEFFDTAREACDSSISGVETALKMNVLGGAALPDFQWCPWTTNVLAEVPPPDDAAQHAWHVSAADYTELALAPGSLTVAIVPGLMAQTKVSLTLTDKAGAQWMVSPLFVTVGSLTYQLPDEILPGRVKAAITTSDGQYVDFLNLQVFAPSLFAIMPSRVPAAWVTRLRADGSTSIEAVFRFDSATNAVAAVPIDLGPAMDRVYLSLLGTGIRNRTDLGSIQVLFNGQSIPPVYAGPQCSYPGVDQINVLVPRSLAGAGTTDAWIASVLPGPRTLTSGIVELLFK